jgi:hypothetical protein
MTSMKIMKRGASGDVPPLVGVRPTATAGRDRLEAAAIGHRLWTPVG